MSIYSKIAVQRPRRSKFPLSRKASITGEIGLMHPVLARVMYPGDFFRFSPEWVVNFSPLVAPMFTPMTAYLELWFCSYRNLYDKFEGAGSDWQALISGGLDGNDNQVVGKDVTDAEVSAGSVTYPVGSIEDMLGIAPGGIAIHPDDAPVNLPLRAVNWVWNEFYRDQDLQKERDIHDRTLPRHNWRRDYFTSCRPFRQRGTSPAFPLSGFAPLVTEGKTTQRNYMQFDVDDQGNQRTFRSTFDNGLAHGTYWSEEFLKPAPHHDETVPISVVNMPGGVADYNTPDPKPLGVYGSDFYTFDISEFRRARDIQRYMELNARAGVRYVEYLNAHYGVAPSDSTLQRPQFIGGVKEPVVVSQVLQTSESDKTPQGNLSGKATSVCYGRRPIKFFAREIGIVFGFFYILPESQYQQGLPREFCTYSRWDFMLPEFQHLSEQAVKTKEVFVSTDHDQNNRTFGYQGIYNELRSSQSYVAGKLRSGLADSLDVWHMARDFDSAPLLNGTFIECNPTKRVFAYQAEPAFKADIGLACKSLRPLSKYAIPR